MAIFPGDQLFVTYGDGWFSYRNIEPISPRHILNRDVTHIDDVQYAPGRIPGCWQNLTYVDDEGVLRAATDILMGEFIEVSRALRVPEWMIDYSLSLKPMVWRKHWSIPRINQTTIHVNTESQYLVGVEANVTALTEADGSAAVNITFQVGDNIEANWLQQGVWYDGQIAKDYGNSTYDIVYEDGDVEANVTTDFIRIRTEAVIVEEDYVILLLGGGSYFTHNVPGSREANVFYDWFDLSYLNDEKTTIYRPSKEESKTRPERGEYIHCSDRMFVSFVASRNIAKGEELVVPLYLRPLEDIPEGEEHAKTFRYTTIEFGNQCK
jgi:hypothetical protein